MKIYDCFMYHDEDLLLDFRLNYLSKFVDKFVITFGDLGLAADELTDGINSFADILNIDLVFAPPDLIVLRRNLLTLFCVKLRVILI